MNFEVLGRAVRLIAVSLHLLLGLAIVRVVFRWQDCTSLTHAARRRNAAAQWWARRLCRLLRLELRVRGVPSAGPMLYVANHVSWLDIPCLLALIDATFVAKEEVARWPIVGDMAARAGTIFFPRGEGRAQAAAEQMMWYLARQRSVVLFPEGTTTDGTGVGPFHSRLFQAATRTATPVQPIALRYMNGADISSAAPFIGDDDLLRHLWRMLGERRIVVHMQLGVLCAAGGDRRSLARHTHALVCDMLNVDRGSRAAMRA